MKRITIIALIILVTFSLSSCEEDEDPLSESRPLIEFNIRFLNNNITVCRTLNLTYLVDEEGVQTSYDVRHNMDASIDISVRKGEFIGITAFETDDSTNTLLAFANIDSEFYNETEVNNLDVYYTECGAIHKIIWIDR